jgi:hypothetical protein
MPQWTFFLGVAIGGWVAISIVGGLLVGRLLRVAERHRHHQRRRAV